MISDRYSGSKVPLKHALFAAFFLFSSLLAGQDSPPLEMRGLLLSSPDNQKVDELITFINDLPAHSVNTLLLRINYNYEFKRRPEITDRNALSEAQVKSILAACRKHDIELIPLVNCLGHQSWKQDNIKSLLRVYPEFEENPGEKIHSDDFYCRSYCPLHPEVHDVVFDVLDELVEAFESKRIHVGMDEVFILGEDSCPRCKDKNHAELFAGEVTKLRDHLAESGVEMWIWGDRLIDAKAAGMNKWSASKNGTAPAIEMIPKDVVICDWQYPTAEGTAYYFALKGFNVISCPYFNPEVGLRLAEMQRMFRDYSVGPVSRRFKGVLQTTWSSAGNFLDAYYGESEVDKQEDAVECFIKTLESASVER